ncbi:Gfo/Idh/MocA family oxidoreductase [Martelella lutilitoris]|uniref:Gfo/Idh/MocA family oxidoreductase n=1 Tax=Martelella lutilitoris TaxID=2583532 RepID=A0A7T7HJC0_9HYPH|nr:Gfo/Idh/MocA family oxidoreductase [Martelella lutilitoris]QQM30172.1 Gfo/Idh/MocA family oxidoreductase [Martelella lutilitoris]
MSPIPFAVIGSGWRASFFLKIAGVLPDHFRAVGIVSGRPEAERRALAERWNVAVFDSVDALLAAKRPEFAVVSVRKGEIVERISEFAARDLPVLTETPVAPDHDGLRALHELVEAGARIEVAEQYFLHPVISAMRRLIADGLIGTPGYAHVSIMQTYHGISVMRKLLGIGFENATVTASSFSLPVVKGPGRYDQPERLEIIEANQTIATFDFGDRIGIYDFAESQHRSRIRAPRITVRGERGEITPERATYLIDERTPMSVELARMDKGHFTNFEGYHHHAIMAGGRYVYENPFPGPHLTDDEIAVATCLQNMRRFVERGISSYSFAEAAQDCYLAEVMQKAAADKTPVTSETQAWGRATA